MASRTTGFGTAPPNTIDVPTAESPIGTKLQPSATTSIQLNFAASTGSLISYDQFPEQPSLPLTSSASGPSGAKNPALLRLRNNGTDAGAPVRTKVFDRSPVIKGKISKWKIIPPSPTRPKPPLIRQSAQDVLLPPSREDFEQYYTPGKPLVLLGSIEKKRHYASELKAQAKEREWVGQLENKPPLDRFSTDKFTLCAYAAEYGVPAASLLAIVTYTGDDFRHINADMRREKTLHLEEMSDSVPLWKRQLIQDISTGILAMPKAQKGIVCRKIIVDEELGQKLLPGAIFMDYAFLSTSYRKNFSGIPGNYMLVIALKENRSSAVDVSRISKSPQECEVLFPPGQQFKILSREIDGIPSNEHVPYFDYDPDDKHKDMTVEEVRMRRRLVKVYMYQI
ncbi:MAG TPA: ADP-ribosyltransferase [Aestuariivirgaceae bacterium]|jgi:hypothetical protein|nr:ADP-ribosyltransferase [Aestuariivirgaceae bacterium]